MEPRIQYAKTSDEVSIAYATVGQGPSVVFATFLWSDIGIYQTGTGVVGTGLFDSVVESGRRAIIYDGRGAGLSDREPAQFSAEARLTDLEAVMDALGGGPFDLVGRLHGAAAAVAYAVKFPERVRHLILWNPYARGAEYYASSPFTRAVRAFTSAAIDDWDFVTLTVATWAVGFSDAELAQTVALNMRNSITSSSYLKALTDTASIDVSELLPRVAVATLVIRDTSVGFAADPQLAKQVASQIPAAQFVTVNGTVAAAAVIEEFISDTAAGSRKEVLPRSGLATLLFTDLTSSTALTQRLGDAKAQELVRAHNSIVREALAAQGGSEIKHTGDGIMASFPTASGALECAVAIQRGVALRQAQGGDMGSLSVHIGLNAGEPVAEESDLFGTSVQLARRICDHAESGQILVSDVVRQLAAGKGFLFADIGEVVPKGFEDPVRLYEVRWHEDDGA